MEQKRIVVPRIDTEIRIDCEFDEAAWSRAVIVSPFSLNSGEGVESEKTTLRLCYDSANLYLGWSCVDSDIQATYTKHDSDLWDEEVVEFFIAPHDPSHYFELQWNPLGTVFDATISNQMREDGLSVRVDADRTWHANGMKHKAVIIQRTLDDGKPFSEWRIEAALPFADLSVPAPKVGDTWRGNFYRYNRTGTNLELCAWSPTRLPSFHQPSRFGEIVFGDNAKTGVIFKNY